MSDELSGRIPTEPGHSCKHRACKQSRPYGECPLRGVRKVKPGLTMEVHAGTPIDEAAREAQRIADATNRTVLLEFNGVRWIAWPTGSADKLAELQNEARRTRLTVFHSNGNAVEMEMWDDSQ